MAEVKRKARLGRQTDAETGYALVCNATRPYGNPHVDPLCGKPATHHVQWETDPAEYGLACAEHLGFALGFNPRDVHSVENSACAMPGACWVPASPSYCALLALDERPALAGAARVLVGADRG